MGQFASHVCTLRRGMHACRLSVRAVGSRALQHTCVPGGGVAQSLEGRRQTLLSSLASM